MRVLLYTFVTQCYFVIFTNFVITVTSFSASHRRLEKSSKVHSQASQGILPSLTEFLEDKEVDEELSNVICSTASACLEISEELSSLQIRLSRELHSSNYGTNVQGEVQTPMDVIANDICIRHLKGIVPVMASEEVEGTIKGDFKNGKYQIAFDPLDGSSNLDVNIPTG